MVGIEFPGILAAVDNDVPPEVTVAVALIAGLTGLFGSLIGGWMQKRAAEKQAETARWKARSDRFAAWQVRKREVYADFLGAARAVCDPDDDSIKTAQAKRAAFVAQCDRVSLIANRDLRNTVQSLAVRVGQPLTSHEWSNLVEAMNNDIRQDGPAT